MRSLGSPPRVSPDLSFHRVTILSLSVMLSSKRRGAGGGGGGGGGGSGEAGRRERMLLSLKAEDGGGGGNEEALETVKEHRWREQRAAGRGVDGVDVRIWVTKSIGIRFLRRRGGSWCVFIDSGRDRCSGDRPGDDGLVAVEVEEEEVMVEVGEESRREAAVKFICRGFRDRKKNRSESSLGSRMACSVLPI